MSQRRTCQFSMRWLLSAVAVLGLVLGLAGREVQKAKHEQLAYQKLVALGATGDDWIGWRELFLGRKYAPIVQIHIPPTVSLNAVMPLLSNLDNLEYLELSGRSVEETELRGLDSLSSISSLNLSSTNITDDALPHLTGFTHLRWLYLKNTLISAEGLLLLQQSLPHCKIER